MISSHMTRIVGLANRLSHNSLNTVNTSQRPKLDRLLTPSAFVLTFAGLGLSMFSLHQLDLTSRRHCWQLSDIRTSIK